MNDRLNIIAVEEKSKPVTSSPQRTRREENQAKFDRLWNLDPEQFNPLRNCIERERIERTWNLLSNYIHLDGKQIVDLGSGSGVFSSRLSDAGARVDAVDVSKLALSQLPESVNGIHDCMPSTKLSDDAYDIVASLDLIAHLPIRDHRLYMAELSRLVKRDGLVICSTPLDFRTDGAVELFLQLAETEFEIERIVISYHALYHRFHRVFPQRAVMFFLERFTKFWWDQRGASHIIFIGKRRSLWHKKAGDELPA